MATNPCTAKIPVRLSLNFFPLLGIKWPPSENRRREQNKPGHNLAENGLRRDKQQNAAKETADKTNPRKTGTLTRLSADAAARPSRAA